MCLESLCMLLVLAATHDQDVIQFDITLACLHETLKDRATQGLHCVGKRELGMEAEEGALQLGTSWENME